MTTLHALRVPACVPACVPLLSVLWLTLATGSGCAAPGVAPSEPRITGLAESYRVGPSDTLSIFILPEPEIERTGVRVRPDGKISVDLIGDVQAAGRTVDEIAREIEQRMTEYRQAPRATVLLEVTTSTSVSVFGEVNTATTFPLDRDIRVAESIAMAGGATNLAATSRVRVVRREGAETLLHLVDLDAIRGGDGSTDLLLQPGDLVVVPAAVPVVAGYKLRRALFPLEALFQVIGAGIFAALGAIAGT